MRLRSSRCLARLFGSTVGLVLCAGLTVPGGGASVGLATDATHAGLAVDASGDALVTWSQGGTRESVLITAAGKLTHGGSLSGPDVSRPAHVSGLPSAFAVRSTAGGNLWALQLIAIGAGKPVSLDLSRWQGDPTELEITTDGTRVHGTVTFGGKPVTGNSTTLFGLRPKIYVYIDCFGCGGQPGWAPMLGVAPKPDGSFTVLIRPAWKGSKYRAEVAGPNAGTTYAPDAQTIVSAG
ncbi:MAG TPA: hypothetical protein VGM80_11060 [Gaiellaceae bacterium]